MPSCVADVSLIIPVFNGATYLDDLLDSLGEAEEWFEVVLVDDGSTDNSLEVCERRAQGSSSWKVISQLNRGVSAARNAGLERCSGRYISFVDADDLLALNWKDTARNALRVAEGCAADICMVGRDLDTRLYTPLECARAVCGAQSEGLSWAGSPFSKLFSRAFLMGSDLRFREDLRHGEDSLFNLSAYLRAGVIAGCSGGFYVYRKNMRSATNRSTNQVAANEMAYHDALEAILGQHGLLASFADLREKSHLTGLYAALYRSSALPYRRINEDVKPLIDLEPYRCALSHASTYYRGMSGVQVAVVKNLRRGHLRRAITLVKAWRLLKNGYYILRRGEILERV